MIQRIGIESLDHLLHAVFAAQILRLDSYGRSIALHLFVSGNRLLDKLAQQLQLKRLDRLLFPLRNDNMASSVACSYSKGEVSKPPDDESACSLAGSTIASSACLLVSGRKRKRS